MTPSPDLKQRLVEILLRMDRGVAWNIRELANDAMLAPEPRRRRACLIELAAACLIRLEELEELDEE